MELEMGLGVSMKSVMLWEMQAEHQLSMLMEWESVLKKTHSGWHAAVTMSARAWSASMA